METLQINKKDALKAHDEATPKGKSLLENLLGKKIFVKNIRERIQTVHDVFELNGTTEDQFMAKWNGFDFHEITHAFELLIVAAYCGPDLPDFTDGSDKYYPRFKMGSPSGVGFSYFSYDGWNTRSSVGSRQVFHGPEAYENMIDAVTKFLPEYQKSRTL